MRIFGFFLALAIPLHAASPPPYTTVAEQSGWKITGRYAESVKLCHDFEKGFPAQIRCTVFGQTPEGRPMVALVASADGTFSGLKAKAKGRPVLFFQGGIHSGEIDGKDAGFWALKELLRNNSAASPLRKVTLVFVPVFNIDGHERFAPNHRPNQRGPEEMGWRTTSQNLNLNRDYAKAEAPEMEAMLKFLNEWDPILYVDLHVTDGADFQHEIALMVQPSVKGPEPLREAGARLRDQMMARLASHLALPYYPSFEIEDDPTSGISVGVSPPRFSQSYWALRNRLGVLVETHSWKDYATRVKATYDAILGLVAIGAEDGKDWLKRAANAEKESLRSAGKSIVLTYANTKKFTTIDFKGYAYTRERSEISGQLMTAYNPQVPQIWKIPLFEELEAQLTVIAPKGGYLIPAASAKWAAIKLDNHRIAYKVLAKPLTADFETFRATETTFGKASYEGRLRLEVKGQWAKEKETCAAGALFVPIAQPLAGLVMHLLEPLAPDSFLAWGFFNASFEKKEYMEAYVAEQVAKEMLARDKKLAAAFDKKIANDPEFSKSPEQRLEFFYRLHPSFDTRFNRYPIFRTDKVL